MNIAIFSPSQNPYSETFIQAHKNGLQGNIFYFYGKGASIKLEGEGKICKELGLKKELFYKLKRTKKPTAWQQLANKLNSLNIDSILIEYGTHAHDLLPLLNLINMPVVVHFHGYDASIHDVINSTNSYSKVFDRATYVIAVSTVMKSKLLEIGCPVQKLVLNTYGPREIFHTIKPQFSKKQLIAIGRFTDKKAPYYTIYAFEKIAKLHPESTLVMAGSGELFNSCKNLVNYLGLEKQVIFPGIINENEYCEYLEESRAFIQHSITALNGDMEGTPLAVLEASAAGLPIIATRHAGISDVIIHKETGLLCAEHDVVEMSKNISQLFDDKSLAMRLGVAGKKKIKSNFPLHKHLQSIQNCLESNVVT